MATATWSWSDIRSGLADALETVTDLRVHRELVDKPTPPCVLIGPRKIEYYATMGPGLSFIEFTLVLLAGAAGDRVPQDRLDRYLDPSGEYSLSAALRADTTLGGRVDDVILDRLDEGSYGRVAWAGTDWWGATFSGRVNAAS